VVNDLHALLENGLEPGPYILIGHSVGGLHALLYASQFPSDVAGLVLVNGAHPDQWARLRALLPPVTPGEPARLARLRTMPSQPADNPERLDVLASASQVRRALSGSLSPLDDVPLVVITRSPTAPMAPFLPPEIAGPGAPVWQELQANLAELSSNSTHLIAAEAGHSIHLKEPHMVIEAVLWIASELEDN
jgi:pimeloyl-ACP methyl ester carboxylesterase